MHWSSRKFNIAPPGHLNFWRLARSNPPPPSQNCVQIPYPWVPDLTVKCPSQRTNVFSGYKTVITEWVFLTVIGNWSWKIYISLILSTLYFSYVRSKILQGLLSPFFAIQSLIKTRSLPLNWSIFNNYSRKVLDKKLLNLALPVQIPHPTQAKIKFPTPWKAFCIKFPSPGHRK